MAIAEESAPPAPELSAPTDSDIIADVRLRIRETLRDPGGAEFRNVYVSRREGREAVCGEVNASKALGGRAGSQRFIGGATLLMLEDGTDPAEFSRVWDAACAR
jgi:hypothetical protein